MSKKNQMRQQQQLQKQAQRQIDRQNKRSLKKQRSQAKQYKGYAKHFIEFDQELREFGLQMRDVEGDGNCLFRSIADAMEGNERQHRKYRKMACHALKENQGFYEVFLEDDMTMNDYIDMMESDGEWGGHLELQALASSLEVRFVIHMKGRPAMVLSPMEGNSKSTIHLAYHLVENIAEHYSSVRMIGDDAFEKALPIPDDLFEGVNFQEFKEQDLDQIEGAQFDTPEEEEFMRAYVAAQKQQQEADVALINFQQQQPQDYKLKQAKNKKCNCGSKKTYKDCCMQQDILAQQQPIQQPQGNAAKKQVVYL